MRWTVRALARLGPERGVPVEGPAPASARALCARSRLLAGRRHRFVSDLLCPQSSACCSFLACGPRLSRAAPDVRVRCLVFLGLHLAHRMGPSSVFFFFLFNAIMSSFKYR